MKHINAKRPPESIGASFVKIFWLGPEISKVKEWFQLKVPIPVASGPSYRGLCHRPFWTLLWEKPFKKYHREEVLCNFNQLYFKGINIYGGKRRRRLTPVPTCNQEIVRFSQNPTSLKMELLSFMTPQNVGNYWLIWDGSHHFNCISYGICIKSNRVLTILSIIAKSLKDLRPP